MANWLTPEAVANYLDVPYPDTDGRVDHATDTVRAAVERRRSDLVYTDETTVPDDVQNAAIEWAALIYQARNAPSGYAGYSEDTILYDALGARRGEILRRLGWKRPVVA